MNHGGTDVAMLDIHHGRCDFTTETQRHGVLLEGELTERIIGAAIDVHRSLGPGLLESAYEECLCYELGLRDLKHERQVELPILYKGSRACTSTTGIATSPRRHRGTESFWNCNVSAMKNGIVRRVL